MTNKSISSRSNTHFKLLQDIVESSRARREHALSWIEGERLCQAYLQSDRPQAIAVIAQTGKALGDASTSSVMSAESVLSAIPQLSAHQDRIREIWHLDSKLFAEISPVETSIGWGLLIPIPLAPRTQKPDTTAAKKSVEDARTSNLSADQDVLVLDRIQDPGNLGTMLRSAAAAGITTAWCLHGTTDPWSPKALRAAMGAHFQMSIEASMTETELIQRCEAGRLNLLAASNADQALSLYSPALDLRKPCAWIFGNEAGGVSEHLLAKARIVAIPQSDSVESLNVAAAASICLFEMRRQRLC